MEAALDDDAPKPILVAMLQASEYAEQFAAERAAAQARKKEVAALQKQRNQFKDGSKRRRDESERIEIVNSSLTTFKQM